MSSETFEILEDELITTISDIRRRVELQIPRLSGGNYHVNVGVHFNLYIGIYPGRLRSIQICSVFIDLKVSLNKESYWSFCFLTESRKKTVRETENAIESAVSMVKLV